MAVKTYHRNIVCNAAEDGSGTATNRALRRCKNLSFQAIRRAVTDRSDHSAFPTAFDVQCDGYRWQIKHRDPERAQTWARDMYLNAATFYAYSASNLATYDTIVLRGIVVEQWDTNQAWGELAEYTIGGWCTRIDFNSSSLDGLTARTATPAVHLDYWDGDGVNRWDSGGI